LLSAGIQQKFQQKELFSRDSAKYFAVSESSADLFLESQQLAIKALNINYFVSATGRAAILINTTAVLGGLSPKMERGVFETNGFQPFSGFTGPSSTPSVPSKLSSIIGTILSSDGKYGNPP
jgi:hypothetical protein